MYTCQHTIPLLNLLTIKSFEITVITRMEQTNVNTSIKIQVNSINTYPFIDQDDPKFHT